MTEEAKLQEIKDWVDLAFKIDLERKDKDMNVLFDIGVVSRFKIENLEREVDPKAISSDFLNMFEEVCISVSNSAKLEQARGRIVDSMFALDKVVGLLDFGFEIIFTDIDRDRSTDSVIENVYLAAFQIIENKRVAIYNMHSTIQKESHYRGVSEEYAGIGLQILRIITNNNKDLEGNFIDQIEKLIENSKDKLVAKAQVRNVLLNILATNHYAFSITKPTKWEGELLNNLQQLIPDSNPKLIKTSYPEGEAKIVEFELELFGEVIKLAINWGDGAREFVKVLNPFIKNHIGKELLNTGGIINPHFILVDEKQLVEITKDKDLLTFLETK